MSARDWLHSVTNAIQAAALCLSGPVPGPDVDVLSTLSTLLMRTPSGIDGAEKAVLLQVLAETSLRMSLDCADPTLMDRLHRECDPCHVFLTAMEGRQAPARHGSAISRVSAFIHEHYDESLSLARLAAVAGLTPPYLSDRFHREIGTTVLDYVADVRVEAAKALLRAGTKVEAVSLLVGYQSRAHFTSRFKSIVGMTPSQFRASCRRPS
jgi:AraC-like DNA-binding protein